MLKKDAEIIQFIIETKESINISDISKKLGMNYKNVYSIIKRLEKESIVRLEPFGKSNKVMLVNKLTPTVFQAEYSRRNGILKNKNLSVMLNSFRKGLKIKCYILLIFGSFASKSEKKGSDIDLMFIVPSGEEIIEKEVDRLAKALPLPLHIFVFSEQQFLDMLDSKEQNVAKEAAANYIILQGIESYYDLNDR